MDIGTIKVIDFVMGLLGPACGMAAIAVVYRQMRHPTMRSLDLLTLCGGYAFAALFFQFVDMKLTDLGLHWVQVGDLRSDVAEQVFGGALFMAAFWMGSLVLLGLWIWPNVMRLTSDAETVDESKRTNPARNPSRQKNWPWA